jgi:hypothetical protein
VDPETPDAARVNPELVRFCRQEERLGPPGRRGRSAGAGRGGRSGPPSRVDVVDRLDSEGLLPAITFIFSRAGCEAAVQQFLRSNVRLLSQEDRLKVRALVTARTAEIPREDLNVLGYPDFLDALERGVAAHHAGMLPTFKEIVEELFVQGLVKAVFATETLALGINMPARSVVLESLVKWNGEAHVDITPGEYTQLTGRAGRRGIDIEGHAVVLYRPGLDPRGLAGLASTRTYPLRSSFKPSYNMAVNLVGQVGTARARALLESSFAQFQADRAVVGLTRQLAQQRGAGRVQGVDDLPPRRLRGVRRAAPRAVGPRVRAVPAQLGLAPGFGRLRGGEAQAGRRDHRALGPPRGPRRGAGLGPRHRQGGPAPGGAHRRAAGRAAVHARLPGAGGAAVLDAHPEELQRQVPAVPPGPGLHAAHQGRGRGRQAAAPRRQRTDAADDAEIAGCARRCAGTRATAATTGRTTRAGPSATGGCSGRPSSSSGGCRAGRTRSRAPSTASARC